MIGKLPGLVARLALVLTYLDWATEGGPEPHEITVEHFGRAAHLVEAYLMPMARRAYADASTPKAERAGRRLVGIIRKRGWTSFTSRDVLRLDRSVLGTAAALNPALSVSHYWQRLCERFGRIGYRLISDPPKPSAMRHRNPTPP